MSILDASLRKTWDSLRVREQVQNDVLDEVRPKGLHEGAAFSVRLTEQINAWRQVGAR